jgi:hypothetical protein
MNDRQQSIDKKGGGSMIDREDVVEVVNKVKALFEEKINYDDFNLAIIIFSRGERGTRIVQMTDLDVEAVPERYRYIAQKLKGELCPKQRAGNSKSN